jgi:hypothetical protein
MSYFTTESQSHREIKKVLCVAQYTHRKTLTFLRLCVPMGNSYLNFKVVSANKANTSDAIQKRTIILDSDQPSSSKW